MKSVEINKFKLNIQYIKQEYEMMKNYNFYLNSFLKNLASNLEQNRSSLSQLGHSRYLSNLLRQISQKSYSFMQYPG